MSIDHEAQVAEVTHMMFVQRVTKTADALRRIADEVVREVPAMTENADYRTVGSPEIQTPGCCSACRGTGMGGGPETNGLCWDCRGTGCAHPHRCLAATPAGEEGWSDGCHRERLEAKYAALRHAEDEGDLGDDDDLDPCNHCPHDLTRHRGDGVPRLRLRGAGMTRGTASSAARP